MKYEKYKSILASADAREYLFISEGPKGRIQKIVQYMETDDPEIYNLAFGDLLPNGDIDDQIKNDNKDRNKILATIAITAYEFTSKYPKKMVVFTGSTAERTRLYRMAITNNLAELSIDFELFGLTSNDTSFKIEKFAKGRTYTAFAFKRKIA